MAIMFTGCLVGSLSAQATEEPGGQNLIRELERAEKLMDKGAIRNQLKDDAVFSFPDELPFAGDDAIASLYEYLWQTVEMKTVGYSVERTEETPEKHIEYGRYFFSKGNTAQEAIAFKAVFERTGSPRRIAELVYGDTETISPELLKPTGDYEVGQATHFYNKTGTKTDRVMAFQVWYPAEPGDQEKAVYQSAEISRAAAEFLGLPSFVFSFTALVESNSFNQPPVVSKRKFPVLIYNHGYGGFTSVYQSVFEELASHGYIVVSVGHENESSLLIIDGGGIITTDPKNEFYSSRAQELNGPEINSLQETILTSDDLEENERAYKQLIKLSPLHNESTRLWASDTKSVIAKLKQLDAKDQILRGAFNFEAIGVFGHSVGGAVAGQLAFGNNEIRAGINLDGFQFGDLINNRLRIPFMFVSSNQHANSYLRATSSMNESETVCYQVTIKGFSHGIFTDLEQFMPGRERATELQRDLILAFFNKYLKNDDVDMGDLETEFPEVALNKNSK
ncbi:MAG: hypothetical protein GWP02_03070 [Desulfobulbaceae bacterium]|nr:hypothetical protein [Desulfobulbaceae bacterium]